MQHQEHFGRKFYLDQKIGYWISTDYPRVRAHVWVWMSVNGPIEKGFHIHHKDGDKSNNSVCNLEKLHYKEHLSLHCTLEKKEWAKMWCEIIRPLTKKWHSSIEGKMWHTAHAKKYNFGHFDYGQGKCIQCTEAFKRGSWQSKFCSNNCKSRYRRQKKLDDIQRLCLTCGGKYTCSKYGKRRFCGQRCAHRWKENKKHQEVGK